MLENQQEEDETKAHLYTIIKVARGEDLWKQVGNDIYFDLVDHDKVRSFRILKQSSFHIFKVEFAKALGIPVEFQCFWIWSKRQNQTYRPDRRLTPEEEEQKVGELTQLVNKTDDSELNLFLEVECRQDYYLPPPNKGEKDILLFFKLYDPEKEQLRYVGRLLVKSFGKPIEILKKLNKLAGFVPGEEIELFEEIMFKPKVMCKRLEMTASFETSEIKDGCIICFQKRPTLEIMEQVPFPYVLSFFKYVKSRQVHADKEIILPQSVVNEENQTAVEPQASRFTWKIKNFTHLKIRLHYSEVFVAGSSEWRIIVLPKGKNMDRLSVYLGSANLPKEVRKYVKFSFEVVNQIDSTKTIKKGTTHCFSRSESEWGYASFMRLSDLHDPSKGFLVNDTIVIIADVDENFI